MIANRDNTTRTKARRRALEILYESELRERPATETLADRIGLGEPPVRPFTIELVHGCVDHAEALDAVLASCLARNWTLERMAAVDRNLARIALYEMAHTDTPPEVAINEAVDLAAELSTPESPGFLNGVLAAAARRLAASGAEPADAAPPADAASSADADHPAAPSADADPPAEDPDTADAAVPDTAAQ